MAEINVELPAVKDRPLITFALFAYNQERYIRNAVEGALAQTYEPLEIIISDDCSNDNTFEIIKETVSKNKHKRNVLLNRNACNIGIGAHVENIFRMAQGELIIAAAGDDISMPSRSSKIVSAWLKNGKPLAVSSSLEVITESGEVDSKHSRARRFNYKDFSNYSGRDMIYAHYLGSGGIACLGATLCYSQEIFKYFGFAFSNVMNEDLVLLGRALLAGEVLIHPEKLVKHRVHGANISASKEGAIETLLHKIRSAAVMSKKAKRQKQLQAAHYKLNLVSVQLRDIELVINRNLYPKDVLGKLHQELKERKGACQAELLILQFWLAGVWNLIVTGSPPLKVLMQYLYLRYSAVRWFKSTLTKMHVSQP